MSNPFSEDSIAGYNSNPPPNDGGETVENTADWDLHVVTKIGDPLKNYAQANFANVAAAFTKIIGGGGIVSVASPYTVQASDQGKAIAYSGAGGETILTPNAGSVGSPFVFSIVNMGLGALILDGHAGQTINGQATIVIVPGNGGIVFTDGSNWVFAGSSTTADIGEIKMFGFEPVPSGWLPCDGAAVSRTTYSGLFGKIGETWGVGDGASTFNVPNANGRAPHGTGQGLTLEGDLSGTDRALADVFGYEDHTQTEAELAPHTHGLNLVATESGGGTTRPSNSGTSIETGSTGDGDPMPIQSPGFAVTFGIYSGVFS